MIDMIIKGGKIVTGEGIVSAGIAVEDGKIAMIASDQKLPEGTKTIDVGGRYIIPGVVDPESHVGVEIPSEQDIPTESCAALAGGVTTWGMHLPARALGIPPTEDNPLFSQVFPAWQKMANQLFRTDFFLTPILIEEEQVTEIPQLAKQFGITSYKVYLHGKFAYKFLDFWPPLRTSYGFKTGFDDGMVYQIFEFVSRIGPPGIVCMHCENWEIARVFRERLIKAGRKDMAAWSEGSPHFCEAGHVRTYAYYAKWANCPVYIMHTTTEETVKEIELARTEGVKIFGQTGTNYLTLDYTGHKHVVPIRDRETQEKLWQALNNGIVDTVGTDHVSLGFPREEVMKKRDVWSAIESYTAHAQMHLPILLSEGVNKNRLSLTRMVQVACENPAKIFGLYPKKGAIQVGSDADLVVVDLHLTRKVTDDMILSSSGWSNYEGWEMKGWPVMTILRGDVVMEWPEEESKPRIIGAPKGKYLPRVPGCQFYPMS